MQILLENIHPDPDQPRQNFKPNELVELKNSIKEKGILVPLILENNYDNNPEWYLILDGERRYRCAKELKLEEVPATITEGPLSKEERLIKRFHIQEQHKNWTMFDKARAIYKFKRETEYSLNKIIQELKLKITVPGLHNLLSITDLTEESQQEVLVKKIQFSYLIHLIKITKDYLSFSNLQQREIEKKLISKIENNVFKTVLDFQKFSRLMSTYQNYPEKLEFLDNITTSLEELFKKTELEKIIDLENFYKDFLRIDRMFSEIINKKYQMSQEHQELLKVIRDKINELI